MTPPPEDPQRINISLPLPTSQIDNSVLAMLVEVRTDLRLLRQELTGVEGQPGRLTLVENDVKGLNGMHNYVKGAWAAIIAMAAIIGYLLTR